LILALTAKSASVSLAEMWGHDISALAAMKGIIARRA
jgi:hypothetical protein